MMLDLQSAVIADAIGIAMHVLLLHLYICIHLIKTKGNHWASALGCRSGKIGRGSSGRRLQASLSILK